jgi:hypothetical protein
LVTVPVPSYCDHKILVQDMRKTQDLLAYEDPVQIAYRSLKNVRSALFEGVVESVAMGNGIDPEQGLESPC